MNKVYRALFSTIGVISLMLLCQCSSPEISEEPMKYRALKAKLESDSKDPGSELNFTQAEIKDIIEIIKGSDNNISERYKDIRLTEAQIEYILKYSKYSIKDKLERYKPKFTKSEIFIALVVFNTINKMRLERLKIQTGEDKNDNDKDKKYK